MAFPLCAITTRLSKAPRRCPPGLPRRCCLDGSSHYPRGVPMLMIHSCKSRVGGRARRDGAFPHARRIYLGQKKLMTGQSYTPWILRPSGFLWLPFSGRQRAKHNAVMFPRWAKSGQRVGYLTLYRGALKGGPQVV